MSNFPDVHSLSVSDAVNTQRIQYIAIVGSLLLLLVVFELIRRKSIREQYSLLWLFFGVVFLVISIWRDGLQVMATTIGIAYPPAAFFLILFMALFLIMIQFSIIISQLAEKNKKLVQEIGILRMEISSLKEQIRKEKILSDI